MVQPPKRAGKKAAKASPRPPAAAAAPAPAGPEPSPRAPAWTAREESLVFPAEPGPQRPAIVLPSSGLAEDILALPESAAVAPLDPDVPDAFRQAALAEPGEAAPIRAHSVSFFAAPAREERKAAEATEHLATFFLAGEEYGVDVRLVQEIIRVGEITQVPRAPGFIKGVINLRGRIIPVVDLKRKLGLGEVDEAARLARIVVVRIKDRLIGLLVDGASQVLKVPVATIEAAPEEVVEIDANYIRGVAKLEKRLIILMDLQKILLPELREGAQAP